VGCRQSPLEDVGGRFVNETTTGRTCLITGATGYIGSSLTRYLLDRGWNVHAIVRPTSKLDNLSSGANQVTIHVHDGTQKSMLDIMRSAKPEVVFHLASLVLANHEPDLVEPLMQSNVLFGAQLLEAMRMEGVVCIVNTATHVQHYEQHDYNPVNLYAATKQAFESILSYYTETGSVRAITLTLFETYGPNDPRRKIFTELAQAAKTGQRLQMTPGEQWLDVVHIDDVVRGYEIAAEMVVRHKTIGSKKYMLSSGKPIQLKSLIHLYIDITGKRLNVDWGAQPYRQRQVMIPWNRGEMLPGWKASVRLEDGLKSLDE